MIPHPLLFPGPSGAPRLRHVPSRSYRLTPSAGTRVKRDALTNQSII